MPEDSNPIAVLYVDDEADARELVATRLEAECARLTVSTESTAAAALERFEADEFDCIVSDYHLAETDGVSLLESVRAEAPEFPFIMLTRTGSEETASAAISADVTDYVIKGLGDNQYELLAKKLVRAVEHRRAEQAAARTERQLHELTDHTNDVLWMFAADWSETLFVNDAYEEVFGQSTARLEENPTAFLDTLHPEDRDTLIDAMERVVDGESIQITYRVQPTPEEVRWVESHGEPIYEDGEVTRVAGFSRDITERRETEETLRRRNEELDMFTSVVAHDLRNPLNVASGYLDILDETTDAEAVAPAKRAVGRMERLVTDLLTLARQGDVIDDRQRVALGDVARRHWQNVATGDATLRVVDAVSVECDPDRLGQALENLYRNAIEHTDGVATVTVGRLPGANGFYIEDDGSGIPAAEQKDLLADGANVEGGSGEMSLGITIVKRIVEAHEWTVEITDGTDGGARFEVTGVAAPDAET